MNKLTINDIELKGKRCFIRVDFNVPFDDSGTITDETRLREALPTIKKAMEAGAKVILASHLGRPKGEIDPKLSTRVLVDRLQVLLGKAVRQVPNCIGKEVQDEISRMEPGDVLLLENLRFYKEESKNEEGFARELAKLTDVYINDAFGTAHRAHASTYGMAKYVSVAAAGLLMKKEIDYFERAMVNPIRPFAALLGGAKAAGKIEVIRNLQDKVDKILIGGGLSFTFLKALGFSVGKSLVEDSLLDEVKKIMERAREKGNKFYLPVDFVVADRFDVKAETKIVPAQEIPDNWMALDIGPATAALFTEALSNTKTIIWNGPMGVFEMDPFSRGTYAMVNALVNSYALTIVGGGDSDVAIHRAGAADKVSYISTGGGAFIQLLEGKPLPAIEVLHDRK